MSTHGHWVHLRTPALIRTDEPTSRGLICLWVEFGKTDSDGVFVNKQASSTMPQLTHASAAWTRVDGQLMQVAFDGTQLCGVNSGYHIFGADENLLTNPNWWAIQGLLKWVAVWKGYLWGVNHNDDIFFGLLYGGDPKWTLLSGKLCQISSNGREICRVNAAHEAFYAAEGITTEPAWKKIGDDFVQLDISPISGHIFGVTTSGDLKYWDATSDTFVPVDSGGISFKNIAFGDGAFLCGVDKNNFVYCSSTGASSTPMFKRVDGRLTQVAVWGSHLYGVTTSHTIFTRELCLKNS